MTNQMSKPTTVDQVFPSKWLRADDLVKYGAQGVAVTVERAEAEYLRQMDGTHQWKPVVYFVGASRALICNVTQARSLAAVAGSETISDWAGARVVLAAGVAKNGKNTIIVRAAPAVHE